MRLLQIRFKNLNSLAGEWGIDFENSAYLSDGIFAITGPTGAGKSTILDAICLALYGRTPRLDKITASSNEIMSRQTGECFAEVTFLTQKGRYRSHWSQHRSRKQPGGKLQNPKQEVSDAATGEILESKIKDVANKIEEVTGLNFDRFTRSILLAQGGFAAFLSAPANERADILEQITGTELYSDISRHVHELHTTQQKKLEELEGGMKTENLLEPEEEEKIRQEMQTGQEEETRYQKEQKTLQDALAWLGEIATLQKELVSLRDKAAALEQEQTAFQPKRAALALAEKAATLDGTHATLQSLRQQQEDGQAELAKGEADLPALKVSLQHHADALSQARTRTEQARAAAGEAAPTIRTVYQLDHDITGTSRDCTKARELCKKTEDEITDCQGRLSKASKEQEQAQTTLDEAAAYLKNHEQDSTLIRELSRIEQKLDTLAECQQDVTARKAEQKKQQETLTQAHSRLTEHENTCTRAKAVRDQAQTALTTARQALHDLLEGQDIAAYTGRKEQLLEVKALRQRVRDLEAERVHLEDGEPCPLCGAKDHPYAHGNTPPSDDLDEKIGAITRLITAATEQQKTVEELKTKLNTAENQLTSASTRYQLASGECDTARQRVETEAAQLANLQEKTTQQEEALHTQLEGFAVPSASLAQPDALLAALRQRCTAWQNQADRQASFKEKRTESTAAVQTEMRGLTILRDQLEQQKDTLAELETHLAENRQKRRDLFGEKDPQEEETRLNAAITQAEAAQQKASQQHEAAQAQYNQTHTRCVTLKEQITSRQPQLEEQSRAFLAACKEAGLEDEARYLAVSLPPQKREALASQARQLDKASNALADKQKDRQTRLQQQQDRALTTSTAAALAEQEKTLKARLATLQQSQGQLAYRLTQHDAAKEHQKTQLGLIEAQRKECRRWHNLHELIGSADGKKYRNFAQGLTFEIMIRHANQQLAKMTDRYLLTRNNAQPLELNVIDNYQAGEMRSTKNLSGGESFLVSLTLALGMSQMASRTVQIDSLFLDEGFGTLDEDALDSALETLSTLQEDGKLIGIISHVEALKERITTQILVTPRRGGKSQLAGPGIEHEG